jgi:dihydrofolate reductase
LPSRSRAGPPCHHRRQAEPAAPNELADGLTIAEPQGGIDMKLTTTTQVSVDGVMQGPGGPEEDERRVFERGGWAHFDNEAGVVMDEIFQRADAFLFGRRTYEIFAGSWGTWDDPGDSPIWTALSTLPKYVASTTLSEPRWTNTTVLSGDVATAIRELKAKPGRELQVQGSGALFRWLFDNDLVDELTRFTFPVVVGQGTRLFPDTGPDRALDLVDSRATASGVTIQVYRPAGRPQYGMATPDTNT